MTVPSWAVPPPSGRPSPVGGIEMSQAASASSFTGSPSPGPASAADAVISESVATATAAPVSDIDIADLPALVHLPGLDRVVVVDLRRAVVRVPVLARPLGVAVLVGRPTLKAHGA